MVKIKNEKRYRDSKNILIDCLIGKNMNYDNLSCFNVDNNICFNVNNTNGKHAKSFPGKDTNLNMNKYKRTFMDSTHKKIREKLSAGNLSGLSNENNVKWQRNSHNSTDTETPDPDANDLQVPVLS